MVAVDPTPAWDFQPAVLNVASLMSACLMVVQPDRAAIVMIASSAFIIMVFLW